MTRTILAAATAFLAATTLMADPARACISCEYTPEVVRESLTSRPVTKPHVSAHAVMMQRRVAKPRFVRPSRPTAKPVEIARTAPKASAAKDKGITTGSVEKAVAAKAETAGTASESTATSDAGAKTNDATAPASASTALIRQATRTAEVAPAKPVGCKKFLPAVGVTVDCN